MQFSSFWVVCHIVILEVLWKNAGIVGTIFQLVRSTDKCVGERASLQKSLKYFNCFPNHISGPEQLLSFGFIELVRIAGFVFSFLVVAFNMIVCGRWCNLMNRFLFQVFRQPHTRPTRPVEVTRATLVSDYRTQQVIPWPVYTIITTRCRCCRTPSITWGCTAARQQPPACMPCPCERKRVADVAKPTLLTKLDVLC